MLCAQTKSNLEQFQTAGQLIGAAGATAGAVDAAEAFDGLIDGHTFDKGTYTLGVAAATANELYRFNDIAFDSNGYLLGTNIGARFENNCPDAVNSIVADDADAEILFLGGLCLSLVLCEKTECCQN